jgi:hypothetical protein
VTGEGPRALDQIAQLGVGSEMDAEAIGRKRFEFASPTTRVRTRGPGWEQHGIRWDPRHFWTDRRRDGLSGSSIRQRGLPCGVEWLRGFDWCWSAHWQTTDLLSHIRSRKPYGQKFLDLSPSLAPTRFEEIRRVFGIQMRRKRAQRTQVQLTASDPLERLRESSTHARSSHASPGRAFTHPQGFHAVRK